MTGSSTTVRAVANALGVDTHRDVNVAYALDRLGRRLDERTAPTTQAAEVESTRVVYDH